MTTSRIRIISALAIALAFSPVTAAIADTDPFPGIALGGEIGARQYISNTGVVLDGSTPITCASGAGLGVVANATTHEVYQVCTKTWRPTADVQADIDFQQAQRDASAAAELLSQQWNAAHPGQQKCFQWGPIVHANGISTSSGGVCANPVPVPAGASETATVTTVQETSTPFAPTFIETSTPVVVSAPAPTVAPVNTNGFGGYAVVHPDGHVCGVIVSASNDPFNNGGVMPNEYMGCPPGSRIVFQSAPSADGNVAGWHGPEVVLSGNTYTLPGGSTITSGIVSDPNGRTWNSGTGQTITPGTPDTRTVLVDTTTVLADSLTALAIPIATALTLPITSPTDSPTVIDDLESLPEITAEEEISNSIDAKVVNNKTRIDVATEWIATKLTIVATKKGSKKKYTYRFSTDNDGNYLFKSSVNLKGFTLVLLKGSEELTREIV
jgi:hypothetical protein